VDAVAELTREHDRIDRLALRIATVRPGTERAALVREVGARFLVHARAEEQYLYPAVRRLVTDGIDLACFQTRRNRALARTIESLERGEAEGDELDVLVGHLIVALQDHVERQECVLLPALMAACPSEEIELLGQQLHEGMGAASEPADLQAALAAEAAAQAPPRRRGFWARVGRIFGFYLPSDGEEDSTEQGWPEEDRSEER
jgi:hypothetical protein